MVGENLMESSKVELAIEGPYWLTRDKRNGKLADVIEVWLVRPVLHKFEDGDVMWLPKLELVDSETTHYAEWTIDKCLKECRVYPETERECIVVQQNG
jgi:hypothetical protein